MQTPSSNSGPNNYEKATEVLNAAGSVLNSIFDAMEARANAKEARAVEAANREYSGELKERKKLGEDIEKELERMDASDAAGTVDQIERQMVADSARPIFAPALDETINRFKESKAAATTFVKDEAVRQGLDKLVDWVAEHFGDGPVDVAGTLRIKGPANVLIKEIEKQEEMQSPTTSGSWVKDKVARFVAKGLSRKLRDQAQDKLGNALPPNCDQGEDNVEVANCEFWQAAKPQNLRQGIKPYMELMVRKFTNFFGLASDRFVSDEDK